MNKVKDFILELHNRILKDKEINLSSSPDLELRPNNGITSYTTIMMIMEIEEHYDIELDEYFPRIRSCKTIGDLITLVEEIVNIK